MDNTDVQRHLDIALKYHELRSELNELTDTNNQTHIAALNWRHEYLKLNDETQIAPTILEICHTMFSTPTKYSVSKIAQEFYQYKDEIHDLVRIHQHLIQTESAWIHEFISNTGAAKMDLVDLEREMVVIQEKIDVAKKCNIGLNAIRGMYRNMCLSCKPPLVDGQYIRQHAQVRSRIEEQLEKNKDMRLCNRFWRNESVRQLYNDKTT